MVGKFAIGALHGLVRSIFGRTAGNKRVNLSEQIDRHVIKSLMDEVGAFELAVGDLIVERERRRRWHRARLKTIAKRHVQNMKNVNHEQWMREARSLVRYFATTKENDAVAAQKILLPLLSTDRVEVEVEPDMHGVSMGAFGIFKHLVKRGKQYFSEVQHGRKTQMQ